MKVLFVQPPVYDFSCHDYWLKPYGLLQMAGLFQSAGHEVCVFDFLDRFAHDPDGIHSRSDAFGRGTYPREFVDKPSAFREIPRRYKRYGRSQGEFEELLGHQGPFDAVMLTCGMTYWYPGAHEVVRSIRNLHPDASIYMGGAYATLCRDHALTQPVRVVIHSDLEDWFSSFGLSLQEFWMQKPLWEVYPRIPYLVTRLSRGCRYRCTYCAISRFFPGQLSFDPERIADQVIDSLRPETRDVVFYDDTLLAHPDLLRTCCRKIRARRSVRFHTPIGLSCREITPAVATILKELGFETLYLSLETTDASVQKATGGKVNTDGFKTAVDRLLKAGFSGESVSVYLLAGHPDLSADRVSEDIERVREMGIKPYLAEFSPIPGTPDGDRCLPGHSFDPLLTNKTFRAYTWAPGGVYQRLKDQSMGEQPGVH